MKNKIRINKNALNYFRGKARQSSPLEIQAMLLGTVINPELTVIKEIKYTREYADQSRDTVRWWAKDFERVNKEAEEKGLRIVGDLHTHPKFYPILSPTDYRSHIECGFRVSGICSVYNRKTSIYFWVAESALPCEIEYET